MDKSEQTAGITIERGRIAEAKDNKTKFKVKSYTRDGVTTRWIQAVNQYINEYTDAKQEEGKYEYDVGDDVFYFMFPDGRGMILGKMIRE